MIIRSIPVSPESEAIYRMDMQYQGELIAVMSRPLARAFTESSPHIKAGALMTLWDSDRFYSIERNGEIQNFKDPIATVTPDFTRVFHFDMVEGDETALEQPSSVMIPESIAHRLFGNDRLSVNN